MNHLLSILLTAILCATASAQTIKTLGYNSTNGQVVANTGTNVLTFTNDLKFDSGDIQFVGTQIIGNGLYIDFDDGAVGGGAITLDTNSSITFQGAAAATTRANLGFSTNLNTFWTATNAATARTNLSLGLPALTNTSNATMMRALAGSTNTNEPHSGVIELTDGITAYELTFSNGVLLKIISGL